MTGRQARRYALLLLYYVCADPEAFIDVDAWLGLEDDPVDRDRVLDAFAALKAEFARRAGRTRRIARGEAAG